MEEFRLIKGFENYSIGNFGNVKNNKTNRILKSFLNSKGYKKVFIKDKSFFIHRLVGIAFIPNPDNKTSVDHIDNNKTNNNINNLRWCTYSENNQNKTIHKNNKSGYKGIYYDKSKNKWCAQISINNKNKNIGCFKTVEDAIIARYNKAKEIQGEFINECEKIQYDTAILIKQRQQELKELLKLEEELSAILNK
jgi:hypothetical protein